MEVPPEEIDVALPEVLNIIMSSAESESESPLNQTTWWSVAQAVSAAKEL